MQKKIKLPLLLSILGLASLLGLGMMSSVFASGETISAVSSATTELKTATTLSDITINGSDDSTVPVKLLVSNGTLSMTTTTGLTFKNSSGTTLSNPQTGSTLYFSGTRSDVNAALATLRYTRNSTGTDTLEVSLVSPGEVFFSGTGHLYEYVSSTFDWNNAKNAATSRTKYGASGYLTTITSQAENDFVAARLTNAGWMGASDSASEGTWKWVTGPENGTTFCIGNMSCAVQSGQYANWNNGEPNDSGSNEDCGQFLAGGTGKWNDLPCSGSTLPGYVVEYGAPGNMPAVAAANIAITTSDSVAPTTPGKPSSTSPTTDATPTLSWTNSSDSGTGLKNPAYTLEWSSSPTFASVTGSATTNSTSLAVPGSLSDNTWYFRVKATDNANNIATSAISNGIVIDSTAPTVPGQPSVGAIATNDNTPTWTWTASTDSGSGLAEIAYSIQWSQDTDFSGLGGQAGITTNTYTIPDNLSMTDGTWYFRVKAIDVLGNESAWSATGVTQIDTTRPTISNVASTAGGANTEQTITWNTDKDTSSKVAYGPTASLGNSTAETDTGTRLQHHAVTLTNLVACSLYHFTVISADAAGNSITSSDQTFISDGCAGSAEVTSHADAIITTSAGGYISLNTISMNIPANFAVHDADFQVKQIDHSPALGAIGSPSGTILAGTQVYDIKALQNGLTAITSFTTPISITLHYSDNDIQKLEEASLAIYRWDQGTGWTKLNDCIVSTAAKTVTCTTDHFSTFALFGTVPPQATRNTQATTGTPPATTQSAHSSEVEPKSTQEAPSSDKAPAVANIYTAPAELRQAVESPEKTSAISYAAIAVVALLGASWWLLAVKRRKKDQHPT